jgi:methylphosphotriester-DNA--protein-cysteine methyltransferase
MTLMLANISLINIPSVQAATIDNTAVTSTDNTSTATTDNTSSNSTNNKNAIKISLTNIGDIIIANNQQAQIYENTRENTKLDYDNAKDAKDTAESEYNTAESEYNTAESEYNTAEAQYKIDLAKYNEDTVNNTKPTAPTAPTAVDKTTLENKETLLDKAKYALRTANNKYNANLQGLVETAQTDYIFYVLSDLPSKDYNTANVQLLKKAADVAKIQYDSGFLSKNDYTTAQLKYTTALNASNTTNDAEKNDKAKLIYDLGISSGENVTFDTNLEQDLKDVSTINYDNDLTQMFNNNLTLQNDNITIEQASDIKDNYDGNSDYESDSDYDNTLEQYDNTLKNDQAQLVLDKNNAEKDFKTKYDALMNSYATMKNSADSLDQQKNEYNITQIQYDYGFASQQSVNKSNVSSLEESQSFQSDKSKFYEAYLSYTQAKEGY